MPWRIVSMLTLRVLSGDLWSSVYKDFKVARHLLLLIVLLFICGDKVQAQSGAENPSRDSESERTSSTAKVTQVTSPLALFRSITVKVNNIEELLEIADGDVSKILLHLDGYPIKGIPVRRVAINGDSSDELQYDLKRSDGSAGSWDALFGRPNIFPNPTPRKVRVSVGLENQPIDTDINGDRAADLIIVNRIWYWVYVVLLTGLVILFIKLARDSDMLRDVGPQPTGDGTDDKRPPRKPYSLGRTQMALWFFVVIASFMFIWMVTSNVSSLTAEVLGLIGISSATGLGAMLIDTNKRGEVARVVEETKKQRNALEVEIASLRKQLDQESTDELKAALAAKDEKLKQLQQAMAATAAKADSPVSEGFLSDILSDANGVSFHRFQIFAWTIALIIIFISSVYKVLTMPQFDSTLLALMGISSGVYLGFKFPEPRGQSEESSASNPP